MKKFTLITFCLLYACSINIKAQYNNNYSASFNGTDAYLKMPQTTGDMDLHAPFIVEFWMKPKAYPAHSKIVTLFQKANPFSGNGIYVSMDEGGLIGVSVNSYYFTTPAPAMIDFWTHIAVMYNNANNTLTIFFNGSVVNTQLIYPGEIYQPNATYIGAMCDANNNMLNFYKGELDELRVWSIAKTIYDVDNNCRQSFTGMGSGYSSLRVSLPLNNNFIDQGGKESNTVINNKVKFIDRRNQNAEYLAYNSSLLQESSDLTANDNDDFDATTAVTIEFWARLVGVSSEGVFKGIAPANYFLSYGYDPDIGKYYVRFLYDASSNAFRVIQKNLSIPVENADWHHIAATYKASTGNVKFYVDASLVLDTIVAAGETLVPNNDGLNISSYYKAAVDEIRIWKNTVRTQQQIKADMFKGYNYTMNPLPQNVTVYDFDGRMDDVMKPIADSVKSLYESNPQIFNQVYNHFPKASNPGADRSTAPVLRDDKAFFGDISKYKMSTKRLITNLISGIPKTITDSLFVSATGTISSLKAYVFADIENYSFFSGTGVNEMLKFTLISPSGKQVQLTPNYSSQNGNLGNSLYCVFDMSAANKIDYDGFGVLPPYSPETKPYESLNGFKNKKMHGWWKLKMEIAGVKSFNYVELLGWGFYPEANTGFDAIDAEEDNLKIDNAFAPVVSIFPNPFMQSINISYELAEKNNLSISLVDANGKTVAIILDKKDEEAGKRFINFNAGKLTAGIYFCRIEAGEKVQTIKIVKQ